jgi:hypothetical protein
VSPTVGANCHGVRLDLRVGLLTDMENNGRQRHEGLDRFGPP